MPDPAPIGMFKGPHRFLSNFWPCDVAYRGQLYRSVEHAYQAAKFAHLPSIAKLIWEASTAGQAKLTARRYNDRAQRWTAKERLAIMEELLRKKFADPTLARMLQDTGSAELVEGNWWNDRFWGRDLASGEGQNHLGRLLMTIRGELQAADGRTVAGGRL